jgi:hypothetical protein
VEINFKKWLEDFNAQQAGQNQMAKTAARAKAKAVVVNAAKQAVSQKNVDPIKAAQKAAIDTVQSDDNLDPKQLGRLLPKDED